MPDRVFEHMSAGNDLLGTSRLVKYYERMKFEYASIRDWLPNNCHTTLDIGCGIGGINIELANQGGTGISHLIDGDGTGNRKNGLKGADKPWGDVTLAQEFVRANVRTSHVVRACFPWNPFVEAVDCIISLRSWGHHYPVDTYLDLAKRCLSKGGRVIADFRYPAGAKEELEENGFQYLGTAYEGPKCARLVFEKESL